MIPIRDENPTRTTPYVVYALVALNVLVFLYDRIGALGPFGRLWDWSMIPAFVMYGEPVTEKLRVLTQAGPQIINITYEGLHPRWLTIFSSMFMHASLMHIGGNMLYLWIFGNNIEDTLGHFKFVLFYLGCGVLATLAHIYSNTHSTVPTVGASGAIAGVLGAYLLLFPRNRVDTIIFLGYFFTTVEIPAILVLGVWFVTQLTGVWGTGGTVGGGVAYWAHIGGFIAGVILVLLLGGRKRLTEGRRYYRRSNYDDRQFPWRRD